jgi:serine phosphatase RsbU (regulator of sigma subunit)
MLLADVCGFGSLFSEIASELRDLMKRHVNTIQQTRAIRDMSCRLEDASQKGGFASTLMTTYFAPTHSFTLCNAGHPPPLVYRAADATWSLLRGNLLSVNVDHTSLGVLTRDEYQRFTMKLGIGDLVVSYSNSLTECRGSDGATIGVDGLLARVRDLDPARPAEMGSSLANRIRDEHSENLSKEDATILVCQATETPVAWRDNMLAPLRLLRSASDRTTIGSAARPTG